MKDSIFKEDIRYILESIKSDLPQLKDKKILVTGATGFIGTYLIETLSLHNQLQHEFSYKIFGLARNSAKKDQVAMRSALNRQGVILLSGDVRNFKFPEPFDFIIHAAAPVDPKFLRQNPLETADIIVTGTRHILQQAVENKTSRVLYISSGAVYGKQPVDLPEISEEYIGGLDIADANSGYGEAKRYAEILCSIFKKIYDLSVVVARPFTFVGPYQDLNSGFAVTEFIKAALNGKPICIEGDGTTLRSYCYGADLAVALWKILFHGKNACAYNIGSQETVSIAELARMIVDLAKSKSEIIILQKPAIHGKPSRYIPDINRLKTEIGMVNKFNLKDALKRTIDWAKDF